IRMGKASGLFFTLAATTSLCSACMMYSRALPTPAAIVNGRDCGDDAALAIAPEGWRDYTRSAAEEAPVVVRIPKRSNQSGMQAAIVPPAGSRTPTSADRAPLALNLQRELRRVGCYDGELSDTWTLATRGATKAFTNRVNAILPVDKPDEILLALVRDYP